MNIARADWPHVLAVVEQALDLPTPDRDGWVTSSDQPGSLRSALHGLLQERHVIEVDDLRAKLPKLSGTGPVHIGVFFVG